VFCGDYKKGQSMWRPISGNLAEVFERILLIMSLPALP
jgi:hypothetical protein